MTKYLWITRDCWGYSIWSRKPNWYERYWSTGTRGGVIARDFCPRAWHLLTGIKLKSGECKRVTSFRVRLA